MLETLIEAVRSGCGHLVFVGIAGIEDAAGTLPYYRVKLMCEERLVRRAGRDEAAVSLSLPLSQRRLSGRYGLQHARKSGARGRKGDRPLAAACNRRATRSVSRLSTPLRPRVLSKTRKITRNPVHCSFVSVRLLMARLFRQP